MNLNPTKRVLQADIQAAGRFSGSCSLGTTAVEFVEVFAMGPRGMQVDDGENRPSKNATSNSYTNRETQPC